VTVSTEVVPRTIRIAGVLTTLQAVAGLIFVGALLVRSTAADLGGVGQFERGQTYGEAGYFALLAAGVLAAGIGLWKGKHWARTPAMLLQLLLLGTAWYAFGPSRQPLIALIIAAPAIAVLWFLFNREGRAWSFSASTAPDADRDE
jgi:cbb3-type cytochrome oxidase subunit 3